MSLDNPAQAVSEHRSVVEFLQDALQSISKEFPTESIKGILKQFRLGSMANPKMLQTINQALSALEQDDIDQAKTLLQEIIDFHEGKKNQTEQSTSLTFLHSLSRQIRGAFKKAFS